MWRSLNLPHSDQPASEGKSDVSLFKINGWWRRGTTARPLEPHTVWTWGVKFQRITQRLGASERSMLKLTLSLGRLALVFSSEVPTFGRLTHRARGALSSLFRRESKPSPSLHPIDLEEPIFSSMEES
jgi:hypothetical protein